MDVVQELLSFSDLSALSSSPASVRQKFSNHFGKNPDGICVNNETYFNAVKPAITEQYGHPCYKTVGDFKYEQESISPPQDVIIGSQYVYNYGDLDATMSLDLNYMWTEETSWNVSATLGISQSIGINIEFFSGTQDISLSITAGMSGSSSTSKSCSGSVIVTVPAKSKVKAIMIGKTEKSTVKFSAPITVQGMFGANFPDKVNGHYFWFLDAASVLNTTQGMLNGTANCNSVFDITTNIQKAEPLTEAEIMSESNINRQPLKLKKNLAVNSGVDSYSVCPPCTCACSGQNVFASSSARRHSSLR